MKVKFKYLIVSFMIFSLLGPYSFAKGGSSGGGSVSSPPVLTEPQKRDCEAEMDLKKRIQCRFEEEYEENNNPEACRNLAHEQECKALYERSYSCYIKKGQSKDKCFREASKFIGIGVKDQDEKNVRHFAVLVLYDIEERIEIAYEDELISAENAADLISDITRIKRVILEERPGREVKNMVDSFKEKYKRYMK